MPRLAELRRRLDEGVKAAGGVVIAEDAPRIATIGAVALPGAAQSSLLVQFDLAGFAVSAGSACSSGKMQGRAVCWRRWAWRRTIASSLPSHQLRAVDVEADVDAFLAEWRRIAERASARAA